METIKEIIANMPLDRGCSPEALKERLVEFEEEFRQGDGYALIRAMGFCAVLNLLVPDWVVKGLCELDEGLCNLKYETPNDALRWGWQSYQSKPSRKSSLTDKVVLPYFIHNAADLKFNYLSKGEKRPDGATFSHGYGINVIAEELSDNVTIRKKLRYKPAKTNRGNKNKYGKSHDPEDERLVTEGELIRMKQTPALKAITQAKNDPKTGHAWCCGSIEDGFTEQLVESVRNRRPLE